VSGFLESHRLLTLRAGDPSRHDTVRRCEALGAEDRGSNGFWDTCFRTAHGLVQLREYSDVPARLIYSTSSTEQAGEEVVHLVGVNQPEPVIDALLGVAELLGVVAVERRLFVWEGVRVNLDSVGGLGEFVEACAPIDSEAGLEPTRARLTTVREALRVEERAIVGETYGELAAQSMPSQAWPGSGRRPLPS